MTCEHVDYDDYFERCNDCGMNVEEIHASECGATPELDELRRCTRCGCEVLAEEAKL